jgi:hypothetical protein
MFAIADSYKNESNSTPYETMTKHVLDILSIEDVRFHQLHNLMIKTTSGPIFLG